MNTVEIEVKKQPKAIMKIIGLKIEKYVGRTVSGHNCNFEYTPADMERHILCGILSDNRKVLISLEVSEGECYSGWCAASWANINVKVVKKFSGYTFIPKKDLYIDDILSGSGEGTDFEIFHDIENEVFSVSHDGGDSYYPSGSYEVNMDLFKETIRNKKKRPIWIFVGKSNSGKSFLASKISNLDVYETDSSRELPIKIYASIIVIGNKYQFTLDEVKERIFGNSEIQIVNFT